MRSRRLRLAAWVVLAAAGLFTCRTALAWNGAGHMTISLLAWDQLSEGQKAAIDALLKTHPHYDDKSFKGGDFLSAKLPDDPALSARYRFARASTWPDFVRPSRNPAQPKSKKITAYHHGPWHYVDFPYTPDTPTDGATTSPATGPATPPPVPTTLASNESILTAIPAQLAILKNPEAPPAERAVALCWLLHLTEDLHQPLHATGLLNKDFPDGDQGGNKTFILASPDDEPQNLHYFWDAALGTNENWEVMKANADAISKLWPREKLPELQTPSDPKVWAGESHALGVSEAYLNGKIVNHDHQPTLLPDGYAHRSAEISKRRAALAAYRLADELKTIFPDPAK